PIRNASQVMDLRAQNDPQLRWASDVVERQVQFLSRLVDDLLDVARLGTGKIKLRRESTDLNQVVTGAVEASTMSIAERQHELQVTVAPQPLWVDADPARMAQVVGNLLHNAAKFTPEGGRIWLTVGHEDTEAVVRVRDSGIGISAEMLPRVFDLFSQA